MTSQAYTIQQILQHIQEKRLEQNIVIIVSTFEIGQELIIDILASALMAEIDDVKRHRLSRIIISDYQIIVTQPGYAEKLEIENQIVFQMI